MLRSGEKGNASARSDLDGDQGDLNAYVFVLRTLDGGEEREIVFARDDAHACMLAEITGLIGGLEDRLEIYDPKGSPLSLGYET